MRPLIEDFKKGDILVSRPVIEFFEIKYLGKKRVRLKRLKRKITKKEGTYFVNFFKNEYYGKSLWGRKTPEGLYLGKRGFIYKVNKGEKFIIKKGDNNARKQ